MSEEVSLSYELAGEELRRIIAEPVESRLQYFLEMCSEAGQVWTIGADDELIVLANDDDDQFVVAFPHPDFGQDWYAATELEDVDLVSVTTQDWAKEILPGLKQSDISVLVFPTSEQEGILVDSAELAELLDR